MADYKVTDTELISIANAIRTKGGTQSQLEFPTGFVSAVQAIPTGGGGGGDGENVTLTPTEHASLSGQCVAHGGICYADLKITTDSTGATNIFSIPESYKPKLPTLFRYGYGGSPSDYTEDILATNGIASFYIKISNSYRFLHAEWPFSGELYPVTINENIVNSVDGGILINDNVAKLAVKLDMVNGTNSWNNLFTIPENLRPQSAISLIAQTAYYSFKYIRDTAYNSNTGAVSGWRSNVGYDQSWLVSATWIVE